MKKSPRNYRKGYRKRLQFEVLEQKKMLAGDVASAVVGAIDVGMAEQVEVQAAEVCSLEVEQVDTALEELLSDSIGEASVATEVGELDPRNLDLADSMDGFSGTIGPESPTETVNFTAAADGLANIVISNSFESSDLLLTATSENGTEIEVELLNGGFDSISFEVEEGEAYELTVSSTEAAAGGQFQLTVGFEEFVDQHADQAGADSTELVWENNRTELTGKFESPDDIDTFGATAPQSGEVTLELDELEEDQRLNLNVTVTDSNGAVIAEGATNEHLRITFDAVESEEFFVAISGGEGQKGDYRFSLNLEPLVSEPQGDVVVADGETSDAQDVENIPTEETIAEVNDDVTEIVDEVDTAADDVVADLVEVITGDTAEDPSAGQVIGDQTVADVDAEVTIIDEEPAGELVEEELSDVVDQIENVIADAADDVSAVVDVIEEDLSEVEVISEIEEVLDEVSDDVTAIIDVIGEEISEAEDISEVEDVLDEVSDDVAAVVDVIEEEIAEIEGIAEIEDVLHEVSDDVDAIIEEVDEAITEADDVSEIENVFEEVADDASAVVDVIEDGLSEVEAISEIEDVLDGVSDDVSAIVEEVGEELSEIEGISEVTDEIGGVVDEALTDAPSDEIEEAVDQVADELGELLGEEPEIVVDAGELANQVPQDTTPIVVDVVDSGADVVDAGENVEVIDEAFATVDEIAETTGLPDDVLVAPIEDANQVNTVFGTEDGNESIDLVQQDGENQLVDENVSQETEEEDDREFVSSFDSDSDDSDSDSLSHSHEDSHGHHRRFGFRGWLVGFWRALLHG